MARELTFAEKVGGIADALTEARIPHAFGGAIALAFHARPRATVDIDVNIFVSPEDFSGVADVLRGLGLETDALDSTRLADSAQCRLIWERTAVDIFLSNLPVHDEMQRAAIRVPLSGRYIWILSAEHLIVCKAMFDRPKDWFDIEQMVLTIPELTTAESIHLLGELLGDDDPRVTKLCEVASLTDPPER